MVKKLGILYAIIFFMTSPAGVMSVRVDEDRGRLESRMSLMQQFASVSGGERGRSGEFSAYQ